MGSLYRQIGQPTLPTKIRKRGYYDKGYVSFFADRFPPVYPPIQTLSCRSLSQQATVPFLPTIQMTLSLPFQNGEKAIFTAETVAQRNSPIFTKQALKMRERKTALILAWRKFILPDYSRVRLGQKSGLRVCPQACQTDLGDF